MAYSSTRDKPSPLAPLGWMQIVNLAPGPREDLLQQHAEVVDLVLVDGDDEDAVGLEQQLGESESLLHHGQPLGVSPAVVAVDVVVAVLPVPRAGVVRRIGVDAVHLALVHEAHKLQRVVVLTVDDGVERIVVAALDCVDRR